jgi:predicted nucleic acid-binding protein
MKTTTTQIFIDANIFTYVLTDHPTYGQSCLELLEKVEGRNTTAFISPRIIDEVSYVLVIQKARELTGTIEIKSIKRVLPDLWEDCMSPVAEFYRYLDHLISVGVLKVLSLDYSISRMAFECERRYKLLPRDALHAACCNAYGIENIATNDSDFEIVDFLEVWKPR